MLFHASGSSPVHQTSEQGRFGAIDKELKLSLLGQHHGHREGREKWMDSERGQVWQETGEGRGPLPTAEEVREAELDWETQAPLSGQQVTPKSPKHHSGGGCILPTQSQNQGENLDGFEPSPKCKSHANSLVCKYPRSVVLWAVPAQKEGSGEGNRAGVSGAGRGSQGSLQAWLARLRS